MLHMQTTCFSRLPPTNVVIIDEVTFSGSCMMNLSQSNIFDIVGDHVPSVRTEFAQ